VRGLDAGARTQDIPVEGKVLLCTAWGVTPAFIIAAWPGRAAESPNPKLLSQGRVPAVRLLLCLKRERRESCDSQGALSWQIVC